jgi:hypothetical protein
MKQVKKTPRFAITEEMAWLRLSPGQRMLESAKMWGFYLAMGGKLEPEPDTQSPFYFQKNKG